MPTPARPAPDERGKRWLHAQVEQILAASAVTLAAPRAEDDPACSGDTEPETAATLYLRLAGVPEPQVLPLRRIMSADCGSGRYVAQPNAPVLIRRMLAKTGILPAEHERGIGMAMRITSRTTMITRAQEGCAPRRSCLSWQSSRQYKESWMRIFVGNLAYTTTEEDLSHLFESYGEVERLQIMTERESGRSRGFGFVEMPNDAEAQAAMAGLHGTAVGGRPLTVSEARQREDRGGPRRPRQERRPRE